MKKKIKKREELTTLEAEKQSKRLAGELAEELEATGQENEVKAAKWVIEKGKEDRHDEQEQTAEEEWKLHDSRKKITTYKDLIQVAMYRRMQEYSELVPKGYFWYPFKSDKGIVLYFRDPQGVWYGRGMYLSLIPKYDLNCIDRLLNKALDAMEELEQKDKTEGGIILP